MPNCIKTGTINFTSLYFTFIVAKYKPIPKPLIIVNKINKGAITICQCIVCPDKINNTTKIRSEIQKSTRQTKMVLSGIIILGKNTFENKLELPRMELLTSLNTLVNNCHNNIAEATNKKLEVVSAAPVIFTEM